MEKKKWSFSDLCFLIFVILIALSGTATIVSIVTFEIRLLYVATFIAGIVLFIVILTNYFRRNTKKRLILTLSLLAIAVFVSPALTGNRQESDSLRRAYIQSLDSFRGVRFTWGGETHSGVDCSGLARTALWEAILENAVKSGDYRLLGPSFWKFWWRDMSAKAMLDGAYGYTKQIGYARMLSQDNSIKMNAGFSLLPGDLAVTGDGSHVMIYVGEGRWTEASPQDWKVVTNRASGSSRGYFNTPVTSLRWWMFDN